MGELNIKALEESINEIIRRHEVLRTSFVLVDGQPLQVIVDNVQLKIPVINLRELAKAEQEAEIQRLSIEEFQRPFDFTQAPLLRCTLLQLGEQEQILLFTIHHIVFDGWSTGILIKELAALYTAFGAGKPLLYQHYPFNMQTLQFGNVNTCKVKDEKLYSPTGSSN